MRHSESKLIVDPVGRHQTEEHSRQLATDLPSTMGSGADLILIDWRNRRYIAYANPSNYLTDYELDSFDCASHQNSAYDHNNRAQQGCSFSAKAFCCESRGDSSKESADVVEWGDHPDHKSAWLIHHGKPIIRYNNTGHDSLIVTKEQESRGAN
jgi:hypothetical protein